MNEFIKFSAPKNVIANVKEYFLKHLSNYLVLEVIRKSYHPNDSYLYMVVAQNRNGGFAVWTCWNETTQSLNYGHYGLDSLESCEEILREFCLY